MPLPKVIVRSSPDDPEKKVSLDVEIYTISREPRKGEGIPSLKVDEDNILDVLAFMGKKLAARIFRGKIRQKSMGWVDAAREVATDKDGNLDEEKFINEWISSAESFSARGETIGDIEADQLTLLDELIELADTPEGAVRGKAIQAEMRANKDRIVQISNRKKTALAGKPADATVAAAA